MFTTHIALIVLIILLLVIMVLKYNEDIEDEKVNKFTEEQMKRFEEACCGDNSTKGKE